MADSGDTVTVQFPAEGQGRPAVYKLRTLDKDGNTVRARYEAGSQGTILASEAALYPDLSPVTKGGGPPSRPKTTTAPGSKSGKGGGPSS